MGNRYGALLLALLVSLLVYSFLGMHAGVWGLVDLAAVAILVTAVRAIPNGHRRIIATALGIAALVVASLGGTVSLDPAYPVGAGLRALFFGYLVVTILLDISTRERVTKDAVFGACCVYVLLGMAWGAGYAMLEWVVPGSFELGGHVDGVVQNRENESTLIYFSLITLSTVGYGDLAPNGPQARTLAAVEGLVAQLFLAIVIARFVAMEITSRRDGPS